MVSPRTPHLRWKSHNSIRNILAIHGRGDPTARTWAGSGLNPSPSARGRGSTSLLPCLRSPGCSSACLSLTRADNYLYLGGVSFTWSLMPTVLTLLWFITPFPRGGLEQRGSRGASEGSGSCPSRSEPSVPFSLAPGSLCEVLQIPQQHALPVETVTQHSVGHFARGPRYSRNYRSNNFLPTAAPQIYSSGTTSERKAKVHVWRAKPM